MNSIRKQLLKSWFQLFIQSYVILFLQSLAFILLVALIGPIALEATPLLVAIFSFTILQRYWGKGLVFQPERKLTQFLLGLGCFILARVTLQANIMTGRSSGYVLIAASALAATLLLYLKQRKYFAK